MCIPPVRQLASLASVVICLLSLCGADAVSLPWRDHGAASSLLPYPSSAVPTGQAGPIFVISLANISAKEDQVTLGTVTGVVARHSPRIYTIQSPAPALQPTSVNSDTTVFWLDDLVRHHNITTDLRYLADLPGLVAHFRDSITGYVLFDLASGTTNAALIRCAASDGVVAAGTAAMAAHLDALGVPRVANLSSSTVAAEFAHSKLGLSRRGLVAQPNDGSKGQCMADYAVFARIPTIEHGSSPSDQTTFNAVLANFDQSQLSAAYGWTSWDEHRFTASVTAAGGMVHASDFLYNLALFSQLPPYTAPPTVTRGPPTSARATPPRAVHTVAFVNSDGDNIQLLANDWMSTAHWNHPDRGQQPAGWSYSPATAVLLPNMLAYARRTAGANDTLSTGPSGAGYAYPQLFPSETHRGLFAHATGQLMQMAGMSVANVIGVSPSAESVAAIAAEPTVKGVIYFTFGVADQGYAGLHGNVDYSHGTPIVGLRSNLWGDAATGDKVGVSGLVRQLQLLPKDSSDPNAYSVVVNELGNNFSEVVESARLLVADGGFEVVTPEELVARLVRNTGARRQCPLPSGPWTDRAGTLPKCWLPGGDTGCLFHCDNLLDPLPYSVKCDLNVCSNLSLANDRLHFLCADTGQRCPSG